MGTESRETILVLAAGTIRHEVERVVTMLGWRVFKRSDEVPEVTEFAESHMPPGVPKVHEYVTPEGTRVDYYEAEPDIPSFLAFTPEAAGTVAAAERRLKVMTPEALMAAWQTAKSLEDKRWLAYAAAIYGEQARAIAYAIIRDCLYDLDDEVRNLGTFGVNYTSWPEWTLVAADAARWVMAERRRLEGDHPAL
jgi:hypothetical protein